MAAEAEGFPSAAPEIILIFEVHQPYRLYQRIHEKRFACLESGGGLKPEDLENVYFDLDLTRKVFERVSERCYKPATSLFLQLLDEHEHFRVAYSFSGVLLEQASRWAPELLDLFSQVARHSRCEVLGQTYYHSLAYLISREEFVEQVEEHRRTVRDLLGVEPRVFENTELIYDNGVAAVAEELGFKAVVTEGAERLLGWRSPNYVYKAKGSNVKVLLRNYRLSDDIGFRFASRDWDQYPLTAEKYAAWLAATPGQVICIFIDYETIGEHYPQETGIFKFFEWLPREAELWGLSFAKPSETVDSHEPVGEIDAPEPVSWADVERDLSAWVGNPMQNLALKRESRLEFLVKGLGDETLIRLWRLLSISDHYYYMSTKAGGPGEVHSYFSPYPTPYHAFAAFHEAVMDLESRIFEKALRRGVPPSWFRPLPDTLAFQFYEDVGVPTPYSAASVLDLADTIKKIPIKSLEFHVKNGHIAEWFRNVLYDEEAARRIEELKAVSGEELRKRFLTLLEELSSRRGKLSSVY
ncbi:MAG: glycoside hydrolase family 57 protein [Thermofilaceae archaeon]|nr:glycoside hydrolase family 57 protein [Thermofilaceae archaeon]MCX8180239.1 glycoside hydrolase family 57 protein [Thermofilaceae archaeon]